MGNDKTYNTSSIIKWYLEQGSMSVDIPSFTKSAKDLSKNPLGIIALFIVLVYGFACLLFGLSASELIPAERQPIIWFVVLFPLVVLVLFGWLVSKHHDKLYAPKDYQNDDSFLKTLRQNPAKNETSETSETYIQDLLDYANDFEIIGENERAIEKWLTERKLPLEGQTTKVLIRQLAASQILTWFEQTYKSIFGSQILLLKLATVDGGAGISDAQEIFNKTKQQNSDAFSTWSFDQYLEYLTSSQLLEKSSNALLTTTRGKEFIKMVENSRYSIEKAL